MARKRTHTDAPRTKLVSVRLREDTFDRVTAAAAAAAISRATYIETLIEGRAVTVQHATPDAMTIPLINELKRIGNNLNQIAHNLNCKIEPRELVLTKIMREIIMALAQNEVTRGRWGDAIQSLPSDAYNDDDFDMWRRVRAESESYEPAPKVEPQKQSAGPAQESDGNAIHVEKEEAPLPVAPAARMPPPQVSGVGSKTEIVSPPSVAPDGYNPHGLPQGREMDQAAKEFNTPPHPWLVPRLAEMKAQQMPPPRPSLLVRVARALGFKTRPPPMAEV